MVHFFSVPHFTFSSPLRLCFVFARIGANFYYFDCSFQHIKRYVFSFLYLCIFLPFILVMIIFVVFFVLCIVRR
jgi:hypothetical protein